MEVNIYRDTVSCQSVSGGGWSGVGETRSEQWEILQRHTNIRRKLNFHRHREVERSEHTWIDI